MSDEAEDDVSVLYFDRDGEPVSLERYLELHRDAGYRFLERTDVGRLEVVTAWLGLDQGFGDGPDPLIFGTVALDREAGDGTLWEDREVFSATEAQAREAHGRLVELVRAAAPTQG